MIRRQATLKKSEDTFGWKSLELFGQQISTDKVRQAIISRFHTTRWGDEQAKDAGGAATDGNLWRYWTPEVGGTADAAKLAKL